MHKIILIFLSASFVLLACGSDDPQLADNQDQKDLPEPLTISFDENNAFQTMDGIGANSYTFPYANGVGWSWDNVKFVFDEIDVAYIRLAPWFSHWENSNDNDDPDVLNMDSDGFDPLHTTENHDLAYAKFLQSRGIEMMLGIWGAADWLAQGDKAVIDPSDYDELGESIASYLLYMKQNGVDINLTEVQNEPDIHAAVKYDNASDLKTAAQEIIQKLKQHGFDEVMLHGPNLHSPDNCVEWGTTLFSDPEVQKKFQAISYHTWWSFNPLEYEAIKKFAEEQNMPVWATEVGFCALKDGCNLGGERHYLRPETWATAWDYAMSYYRAIDWSGASRVYHWSLLGHDAIVSKTGDKLPSYFIFKHFANYIPGGAVYIDASISDDDVLPMFFKLPDGSYSAVIINRGSSKKQLVISSKSNNRDFSVTELVSSRQDNYEEEINLIDDGDNQVDFVIPARSVTSMKFRQ